MDEIVEKKFKIERIIYYNNSNKWGILATSAVDSLGEYSAELLNNYGNICISGVFEGLYDGCELIISGSIVNHDKYGKQIQVKRYKIVADSKDKEGIINFLSRSLIKGISVQNANKIYDKFKKDAIDTVLNNPDDLIRVIGIGKRTVQKIKESVEDYKKIQGLIKFCTNLGLSYPLINKINEELGKDALRILKTDPYKILELTQAISFKQVDEIYLLQGGDPIGDRRLESGFLYLLKRLVILEGSTGCNFQTLAKKFYETLELQFSTNLCNRTVKKLVDENKVAVSEGVFSGEMNGIVFYKKFIDIEKSISEKIEILNNLGVQTLKIDENVIDEEIHNFPFELNEQQKMAVRGCLKRTISVITGPPGCGKSSITKALYNIYKRSNYNVILLAPTAKACRRLEECIKVESEAQTLHKFLGIYKGGEDEDTVDLSIEKKTVFIVDEASMLDINLFNYLLCRVDLSSRVLLVGDNNQLPSVQAGNVLGDLISSGKVYTALLTDIMRQGAKSHIIKYCTDINNGRIFEPCEFHDFHYEEFGSSKELLDFFLPKYIDEVSEYGLEEVQVITPYKKGEIGQNNLNSILQSRYNIKGPVILEPYRMGDRVRHTRNNYKKDVYNGETGIIVDVNEDGELAVEYGKKIIWYDSSIVDELSLAYCSTVHSSQGSEYKVCFVILDDTTGNDLLLIRRLLYTAVSRGKQKVYILAKPYLVDKCIENNNYKERITCLKKYLRDTQEKNCIFI